MIEKKRRWVSGRWGIRRGASLVMLVAAAVVVAREVAVPRSSSSFALLAGGEWGWLNAAPPDTVAPAPSPVPARNKDLHEDFPLPITGDPYLTQMAAVAETLRRYKSMLTEAQKILAQEQSAYQALVTDASGSAADAQEKAEARVIAQIDRVSQLSARVGEETLILQRLLRRQQAEFPATYPPPLPGFSTSGDDMESGWSEGASCGAVIDVRSHDEFDAVHDSCATNLEVQKEPLGWEASVAALAGGKPKDALRLAGLSEGNAAERIFIVGSIGTDARVTDAHELLRQLGYHNVHTASVGGRAYGVCVCERERERERDSAREFLCDCVCVVCARVRVCLCVYMYVCMYVCVYIYSIYVCVCIFIHI
jgi:rhodanese-related sulfurtransferase